MTVDDGAGLGVPVDAEAFWKKPMMERWVFPPVLWLPDSGVFFVEEGRGVDIVSLDWLPRAIVGEVVERNEELRE